MHTFEIERQQYIIYNWAKHKDAYILASLNIKIINKEGMNKNNIK